MESLGQAGKLNRWGRYGPSDEELANAIKALEEGVRELAEGDHRVVSGSPGPLFTAGWNACAASFANSLHALLSNGGEHG